MVSVIKRVGLRLAQVNDCVCSRWWRVA